MARRLEETHSFEGIVEHTTAKSRLIEDVQTGIRYWVPRSQTYDFNDTGAGTQLFVVSDWFWKKKEDFIVQPRD
jgi:hypothetical protein